MLRLVPPEIHTAIKAHPIHCEDCEDQSVVIGNRD